MAQLQMAIVVIAHGLAAAARDLFEAAAQAVASVPGSGFLADFVLSESGEVSPEQGFPVAWTGGLLVAAMVVLGSPPQDGLHTATVVSDAFVWLRYQLGVALFTARFMGGLIDGGSCDYGICVCGIIRLVLDRRPNQPSP